VAIPERSRSLKIGVKFFVVLALFGGCGVAIAQLLQVNPPSDHRATSIAITPRNDSTKVGSPVFIIVSLTNTSQMDYTIQRLSSGADCLIDVRDVGGKLPPDTSFGYLHNGHVAARDRDPTRYSTADLMDNLIVGSLKAGQTMKWTINVSRFYDLSQPGKYQITVERADLADRNVTLKSNTVTVTIVP
jgi:hypothetical protein